MLRPATLLKKRLWHRCFSVNFAKFLRTPFLTKHLWQLLLHLISHQFKSEKITFHVLMLGNPRFNVISWLIGTVQGNCFLSLVKEICHDLKNISWYIIVSVHSVKAHAKLYQKLKKDASYFKSFIKYIVFNR